MVSTVKFEQKPKVNDDGIAELKRRQSHGAPYELTPKQQRFVLKARREGFEVYFTYSGRFMYGERCPAVNHSAGQFGCKDARQDDMGLGKVTYMPR